MPIFVAVQADAHGCPTIFADGSSIKQLVMQSPDRGRLLAAVRLVDPSVTREQLDDWLKTEREQTLTKVYYNPRGSGSIDRAFRDARRIDPWITRKEVADFLRAQSIKQDLDKKRRLGTFLATAAREQIDIDVADF